MADTLKVSPRSENPVRGVVSLGRLEFPCALGKNGIVPEADKKEGDLTTPAGLYWPQCVYFRPDRVKGLKVKLPVRELSRNSGWCDDQNHKCYNQYVSLPFGGSAESLWRDDGFYDLVLAISHNSGPTIPGKGSAIFFHVAADNFTPTEGCVALNKKNLIEVLEKIGPETLIRIHLSPEK